MVDNSFDPAWALGANDPLREWAANNLDWRTGKLLQQDPQKAIDDLIRRGVPPPDVHADGTPADALPYNASEAAMGGAPIRTNPDGSIAGNITSPSEASPYPPGGASATPRMDPNTAPPTSSLPAASSTPVQTPMGTSPEDQAQDDAQDAEDEASASKSNAVGDALSGFGKSVAGVKAPQPPPLNAVGTPSVRSPTSAGAPNLANLMSLLQSGAVPQTVAPALGRLLVQGKA